MSKEIEKLNVEIERLKREITDSKGSPEQK